MAKRQDGHGTVRETVPHEPVAEDAVVAACILDQSKIPLVAAIVSPDDFMSDANRAMFETLLALHDAGLPAGDPLVFMTEFRKRREIDRPREFVSEMVKSSNEWVNGAHAEYYAKQVAEAAKRRFLLLLAGKIRKWVADPNNSARWIANKIVADIKERAGKNKA